MMNALTTPLTARSKHSHTVVKSAPRPRCPATAYLQRAQRITHSAGPRFEVERIEAEGDYATLHANGKTWLVRERLHHLTMQLDPRQFHRVHRSSIVRLDMIAELCPLTNRDALLRLRDGSVLRASRSYMPALTAALQQLNKNAE